MNSSSQKKSGYHYKREDLYTCVVFIVQEMPWKEDTPPRPVCVKYRNIPVDKPAPFERFKKFILAEFPAAKYMNVYGGQSRDFYKQIKL